VLEQEREAGRRRHALVEAADAHVVERLLVGLGGAEDLRRDLQVEADDLGQGEDGDHVREHGRILARGGVRATGPPRPDAA
jgi:hypothetical protein